MTRQPSNVIPFKANPAPGRTDGEAAVVLIMPVVRIERHVQDTVDPNETIDDLRQAEAEKLFQSLRIPAMFISAGPRIDGGWCSWCGADTFRARHRPTCGPPPRLLPTPPSDRYGGEEPTEPRDKQK
jgi:hypothetical protein